MYEFNDITDTINSEDFRQLFIKIPNKGEKALLARLRMITQPEAYLEGIIDATNKLSVDVSDEFVDAVNFIIEQ